MQTAIITGASSGIGATLARTLSKQNYEICLIGRNTKRLNEVKDSLDGPAVTAVADLDSPTALAELRAGLSEDFLSRLTLLVNNAGEFKRCSLQELKPKDFGKQNKLQIEIPALLGQLFYPYLKKHGVISSIINISSSLGLDPVPMTAHYSAAKAGMINLTKSMALEYAPVRCNCICPGIVDTPIHNFTDEQREAAGPLQALGRIGRPEDIANAALFLASDLSQWTTGSVLLVDGGINLRS